MKILLDKTEPSQHGKASIPVDRAQVHLYKQDHIQTYQNHNGYLFETNKQIVRTRVCQGKNKES